MVGFKLLLLCLLAGSSSAFAVQQPTQQAFLSKSTQTALRMSGGDATPELKVRPFCFGSLERRGLY